MTSSLYRHRALLMEYVRRDLFQTHAGQILGGIWMFVHPIFLMMVYVFVFTFVFPPGSAEPTNFQETTQVIS